MENRSGLTNFDIKVKTIDQKTGSLKFDLAVAETGVKHLYAWNMKGTRNRPLPYEPSLHEPFFHYPGCNENERFKLRMRSSSTFGKPVKGQHALSVEMK